MHLHGGLRVLVVARCCAGVDEGAYDSAVNGPGELSRCPIKSVGMEAGLRREGSRDLCATIISTSNAFAEVVGLDQPGRG